MIRSSPDFHCQPLRILNPSSSKTSPSVPSAVAVYPVADTPPHVAEPAKHLPTKVTCDPCAELSFNGCALGFKSNFLCYENQTGVCNGYRSKGNLNRCSHVDVGKRLCMLNNDMRLNRQVDVLCVTGKTDCKHYERLGG